MGHQQLLITLLTVCVIGVLVSVGVIALQDALAPDNRAELTRSLQALGKEAQLYCRRPFVEGGGEGTFLGLSATIHGIRKLTPKNSTLHGDLFIRKNGTLRSVELIAVGVEPGRDPRYPIRIAMTVWADSTALMTLN